LTIKPRNGFSAFRSLLVISASACVFALGATSAQALPGELDTTFGNGGTLLQSLSEVGTGGDWLSDAALQADGKIVAVGYTQILAYSTPVIARFLPNGTLDPSFGGGDGLVVPDYGSTQDARAVAIQANGRIVVAGTSGGGEFRISRFLTDGSIDPEFFSSAGTRSKAITGGTAAIPDSIVIQETGHIIVGGKSKIGDDVFAIMGLDTDGSDAPGFGTANATSWTSIGASDDRLQRLMLQSNDKIVAVGTANGATNQVAVARFTKDGLLDTTFNSPTGKRLTTFSAGLGGADGALQEDDSIVVAGQTSVAGVQKMGLTRINSNGSLDNGFGTSGLVTLNLPTRAFAEAVVIQPDDKIVAGGSIYDSDVPPYEDFGLVRFSRDGVPDSSFGTNGVVQTPIATGDDQVKSLNIQSDGKILVAGIGLPKTSFSNADFAFARYQAVTPGVQPPVFLLPTSHITSPSKSTLKRKKLTKFAGTAGPAGLVSKVEVGVRKIDKKALKKKRCVWLNSTKAKFKKVKAVKKRCSTRRWLKATGKENWSYKLKKKMPVGSYEISVRATLIDGKTQTFFSSSAGNFRTLKLTE
jgi:uncharacterized delta-60 repeat protein